METTEKTPATGELQFERAEYAAGSTAQTCVICKKELRGSYYTANGKLICGECKESIQKELNAGSAPGRFFKALVLGSIASLIGAGIYYGILKTTGYQFGLVSVLIGWMVGKAVKRGSNGRGGWVYQSLAIFLTYMSIVATYAPYVLEGMQQGFQANPVGSFFMVLLGGGVLLAAPVMVGFSRPITLIIIVFGLWEAWKINKKANLALNGPFALAENSMPPNLPSHG